MWQRLRTVILQSAAEMPKTIGGKPETEQLSITLPIKALDLIEQLVSGGLHGNSRGEVCRNLILTRLEQLLAGGIVVR